MKDSDLPTEQSPVHDYGEPTRKASFRAVRELNRQVLFSRGRRKNRHELMIPDEFIEIGDRLDGDPNAEDIETAAKLLSEYNIPQDQAMNIGADFLSDAPSEIKNSFLIEIQRQYKH